MGERGSSSGPPYFASIYAREMLLPRASARFVARREERGIGREEVGI